MEKRGVSWIQGKEEKQRGMIDRMKAELNLSTDQAKKVLDIFADANKKAQPVVDQKKEIYESAKSKVKNILNPDQQQKWETLKTEMKSRVRKDHGW